VASQVSSGQLRFRLPQLIQGLFQVRLRLLPQAARQVGQLGTQEALQVGRGAQPLLAVRCWWRLAVHRCNGRLEICVHLF
jgi:hypothetical protein